MHLFMLSDVPSTIIITGELSPVRITSREYTSVSLA